MSELLSFLRSHDDAFRSHGRLASLYSDFRYQRQTNPDGYQANVTTWMNALGTAAEAGLLPSPSTTSSDDRFILHSGPELLAALNTPENGRPLALGAVLDEAVKRKQFVALRDFRDAKQSVYAKSWVPSPWQVMRWSLRQLGVLGEEDVSAAGDKLAVGEFVIMANVEAAARLVLDHVARAATSDASRIYTRSLFATTFAPVLGVDALTQRDLSVLLTFLARDCEALSYSPKKGTLKFKSADEARPDAITEEDDGIASIRSLMSTLEPQIDELTARIARLDGRAREAVANKQLTTAKTALRSKKLAETSLQSRANTLSQLEDVYAKIEQAADQVEMVRVMKAATISLKSLNAQTGGVENVQDVVDTLRDEMAIVGEIGQALNESSNDHIDENEVEDELEELERAERAKHAETERREKEDLAEREAKEVHAKLQQLEDLRLQDPASPQTFPPSNSEDQLKE